MRWLVKWLVRKLTNVYTEARKGRKKEWYESVSNIHKESSHLIAGPVPKNKYGTDPNLALQFVPAGFYKPEHYCTPHQNKHNNSSIHIYKHKYMRTYVHAYKEYIHIHVQTYIHINIYIHIYTHACIYTHVFTYRQTSTACICLCLCVMGCA